MRRDSRMALSATASASVAQKANLQRDSNGSIVQINQLKICNLIGEGTFGQVYRASVDKSAVNESAVRNESSASVSTNSGHSAGYPTPGDDVAVKMFNRQMLKNRKSWKSSGDSSLKMTNEFTKISKEINIMRQIEHPGVVKLLEVIDDQTCEFLVLVLELVRGGQIMEWDQNMSRYRSPRAEDTGGLVHPHLLVSYFQDIASALSYLHSIHIVHRDIKPENILVTAPLPGEHDGHPPGVPRRRARLSDFGVAHHFTQDERRKSFSNGVFIPGMLTGTEGTHQFFAPECCEGAPFSGYTADTWAAGLTLYICAFGVVPFWGSAHMALFERIANESVPIPPPGMDVADEGLRNILERLLDRDPDTRASLFDLSSDPWLTRGGTEKVDVHKVPLTPPIHPPSYEAPTTSPPVRSQIARNCCIQLLACCCGREMADPQQTALLPDEEATTVDAGDYGTTDSPRETDPEAATNQCILL